ncbi:MAG: hypothetical protein AAF750_00025 [Planctomycetota bacterium]
MRKTVMLLALVLSLVLVGGSAWAQGSGVSEVVQAERLDAGGNWIPMAVGMLLAVCVGVGCFLSPKRSHLD